MYLPNEIFSGHWCEGHIQGIAVDLEKGFVYYSFTTILLKTDLQGNPIGGAQLLLHTAALPPGRSIFRGFYSVSLEKFSTKAICS